MNRDETRTIIHHVYDLVQAVGQLSDETSAVLDALESEDLIEVRQGGLRLIGLLEQTLNGQPPSRSLLHDLRTPLNIIVGYSEMLLDNVQHKLSPTQISALQHIYDSSVLIGKQINDHYRSD